MKIAQVTEFYYPDVGGMPEHVHNLSQQLERRGHDVVVVTAHSDDDFEGMPNSVPVRRVGTSLTVISNGSLSRVSVGVSLRWQLAALLRESHFDIIHVHSPTFPVLPILAIKCAPREATLVGTLHTHYQPRLLPRLFAPITQRYLDALDGLIAVAENAARSVAHDHLIKYRIIPNGVDLELFGSGHRLPEFDDGKLNILFLGRLEPRNDVPRLLAAFSRVRSRGAAIRLILVGDGPMLERYRASVEPALSDDVIFAGRKIGERPDYLASADVFCFPARIVSTPVALREAMAAGRACIANDIDGCRQLIDHERNGVLISSDGVQPLADAIERLLSDPDARARMGACARERVSEFAWPVVASQIEQYYFELRRILPTS